MGQRYAVLPLQAPHLEGNGRNFGRSFGRGYRGGRGYKEKYPQNKQKEDGIKEDVKQILLDKFDNTDKWTEEQKEGIKNTLKAQVGVYADMILKQAEEECYNTLPETDEAIPVEEEQRNFYNKLHNVAIDIAEKQFDIDQDFDIEEAIKREKSLLEKVRSGELTSYMAKSYLEEPLLYKGEIKNKYKQYVDLYNSFTTKGRKHMTDQEEVSQKGNKGSKATEKTSRPTTNQTTRESEKQKPRQPREEEKEYLNIQTVRRNGKEEVGGLKGFFIDLGNSAQRLLLKIYKKIPKVFRDSLEELGKNGFSKKWRYLLAGAVISNKLDDSREEKMREERMNFHDRVTVPHYHEPHHCEHHHYEPYYDEPDYDEPYYDDPHDDR